MSLVYWYVEIIRNMKRKNTKNINGSDNFTDIRNDVEYWYIYYANSRSLSQSIIHTVTYKIEVPLYVTLHFSTATNQ